IRYCYQGLSAQDWLKGQYWNAGPAYFCRNVIEAGSDPRNRSARNGTFDGYDTHGAIRVGHSVAGGNGRLYLYHNTVVVQNPARDHGVGLPDSGGKYFSGIVSRNNLWRIQSRVFVLKTPQSASGHSFDCDNVY